MLLIRAPSNTVNAASSSSSSPRLIARAGTSPNDNNTNNNNSRSRSGSTLVTAPGSPRDSTHSHVTTSSPTSTSGMVPSSRHDAATTTSSQTITTTRRMITPGEAIDALLDDVRANRIAAVCNRLNTRVLGPNTGSTAVANTTITTISSSSNNTTSVTSVVDVNSSDSNGESPLWAATISLNVSMISVLLQYRANANILSGPLHDQLPLVVAAASSRHNPSLSPLSSPSSSSSSSSSSAVNSGSVGSPIKSNPTINVMKALLQGGAEVSLAGRDGRTALHV
jgi:ankyrin repeat protein